MSIRQDVRQYAIVRECKPHRKCRKDCREYPDYVQNEQLAVAQLKINLQILLSSKHKIDTSAIFSDVQTLFNVLNVSQEYVEESKNPNEEDKIAMNELCVSIWNNDNG